MEKLPVERRAELGKMSTDRLRARLIKAGFEEDDVLAMERGDLLTSYAEYLITQLLWRRRQEGWLRLKLAEV